VPGEAVRVEPRVGEPERDGKVTLVGAAAVERAVAVAVMTTAVRIAAPMAARRTRLPTRR